MRSRLNNAALFQNDDPVALAHRRKPVRHDQHGAPGRHGA